MSASPAVEIFPVVRGLARTAHAKDASTFEHGCRMIHSSALLGEALGLNGGEIGALKIGAMLHDTGKCTRSEEHTSELQSLMRISYAVFCLKKKISTTQTLNRHIY